MPFVSPVPVSGSPGDPFSGPRVATFIRDSLAAEYCVRSYEGAALSHVIRELTADPTEAVWSRRDHCWRVAAWLSGRLADRLRADGWRVEGDPTW